MNESVQVCEIFKSIQGESSYAGLICSFVRLAGCNLCCNYCDTKYAAGDGTTMTIDTIVAIVESFHSNLVEITGGEPLLHNATPHLARHLLTCGKKVLVETNGSLDISILPQDCIRIVDIKCPGSTMGDSFLKRNIGHLSNHDEVKFVLSSRDDFDWAVAFIHEHRLHEKSAILFSPVCSRLAPADCARWILESNAPVRLQLQLHKSIWGDKRGV